MGGNSFNRSDIIQSQGQSRPVWLKWLGATPVILLLFLFLLLLFLRNLAQVATFRFDPPFMLASLNTFFLFLPGYMVALLAAITLPLIPRSS